MFVLFLSLFVSLFLVLFTRPFVIHWSTNRPWGLGVVVVWGTLNEVKSKSVLKYFLFSDTFWIFLLLVRGCHKFPGDLENNTTAVKFWAATQKKMFSKKSDITTPRREPVVECVHKSVERCHFHNFHTFTLSQCQIQTFIFTLSPRREPVVECVHKSVERCHYTYTTQFLPHVQEVCSSFTFTFHL